MDNVSTAHNGEELLRRGVWLSESGQVADALACLIQASELCPDEPHVLESLATAYMRDDQYLSALHVYDQLIELGAATAATWRATGNALTEVGEYAQAIGAYENGLGLEDHDPEAHHNLARVLYRLGHIDRAMGHLETATSQCDDIDPWLSLATIVPGSPGADQEQILHIRKAFARKLERWAGGPYPETPVARPPSCVGKVRVGYLSAYFHRANYMKPVWGLINHHDRSQFELHLFTDSPAEAGMPGYRAHAKDHVHDTAELDNEALAELIRAAGIDVLVDLNAYSIAGRLPLFLRPLAPVTLAWFNMYATAGLPGFDCVVGDNEAVRPGEESFYAERVLRLPLSYLTFEVTHPAPPVQPPPCLTNNYLTLGSLVSQYKITPPTLDAWSRILKQTDNTRLLIANTALKSIHNRAHLREQFEDRGVDAHRLILEGPADHVAYLQKYDRCDVALDTFPYNGGTTTMEALWQGLPVLTLDGDRWAARTSASLLRNSHLREWVAHDTSHYVSRAVEILGDPTTPRKLAETRRTMRNTLKRSSVCNTKSLAKNMERLYQQVLHGRQS